MDLIWLIFSNPAQDDEFCKHDFLIAFEERGTVFQINQVIVATAQNIALTPAEFKYTELLHYRLFIL